MEIENNTESPFESFENNYEVASKTKRFLNYIIDSFVKLIFLMTIYSIITVINPNIIQKISSNKILEYTIAYAVTFTYYHLFELLTGKTIGKLITKTKVVDSNYNKPTSEAILYRSLYRLVPFDALSFIGEESEGWHDKWSETMVVNEK